MKEQMKSLINRAMWVGIILFILRCLISWSKLKAAVSAYDLFGYAGEAIGVAAILMLIYEKWLWRYDPSIKIPFLAGKYEGTLCSTFDDMKRMVNLEISQTLLSVEVLMKTDESISRSVSGAVTEVLGKPELIYTYLNEPQAGVRDKSSIHFGTATFIIDDNNHLTGTYYTDRNTNGDMSFQKIEIK